MKKNFLIILGALFLVSAFVIAEEMSHQHKGRSEGMEMKDARHAGCLLCELDADFSIKETKDGVILTIRAKKNGDDIKTIQERIKEWLKMRKNMSSLMDDEIVECAVMKGMKMKKSETYANMEYKGKTYYFCCKDCHEKFMKNPEKYAK